MSTNIPKPAKNVYQIALDSLVENNATCKSQMTRKMYSDLQSERLDVKAGSVAVMKMKNPGRPGKPELVNAKEVPRRNLNTDEGRIALLHALAHIEFNAINLGLDAVYRFQEMPRQFVFDWAQVASEEAVHFCLIRDRLLELGSEYGAMPAHNGLWDMAVRTDHDVMVRMALVPRVLEARGLDVAPRMIDKLQKLGDKTSADILSIIYHDEIGHVRIGNHWFKYVCKQRSLDPSDTFIELINTYNNGFLRGPFNHSARTKAGFTKTELQALDLFND